MKDRSDEDLFVAFQADGDHDALSTLFRRRADELLRLAVFLSPRPSEADDLLQATFLSAIARAETYRPGNRVMSWLCGILTNHARMLRRADRRGTPDAPPEETHATPVDAALRREVSHALQAGITGLKEPYRSVMRHHLQDGLNSQQIGEQMNTKPATVRKQMARAIEKLRAALPLGLATGVALRLTPAQIADRAVEAAPLIGGDGVPVAFDSDDDLLPDGVPVHVMAQPLTAALALAAAASVAALTFALWPAAAKAPSASAPVATAAATAPTTPPDEAASQRPAQAPQDTPERARAAGPTLTVQALDADEQPLAALSLMCIADDGRPLQSRLLDEQHLASVTDASGRARFDALPPGRYDVTLGGAVSKAKVTVTDRPLSRTLRLPRRTVHVGLVTDPFGRPVADAEVWVTETAGRADLPAVVARTDAGGAYRLDHPLNDALVFARHADYSQSASARLTRGTERRLTLEPPTPSVSVTVVDGAGAVVAGALCAVVPRSQSTTFYAPLLARTDTDGRASVPGPGRRQAALLVQHPDFAPQTRPLEGSDQTLLLTLLPPKVVTGTARASDGAPLAGREVIASVAGDRTNEPTGPLFARRAVVGADGTFRIAGAPSAILQVRIVNSAPRHEGPPLAAYVAAGVDLDTRTGERFSVDLIEPQTDTIRGTLTTPDGRALAAHHIVAVPSVGVAGHRLFRRRIAHTDASGAFELPAVAAGETYEIAVFPPRRWWPNPQSWPIAFATARAEQACDIVVASADEPTASLSCQALLPDGRPASDAVYELRHLAYQTPLTRPADKSGRTTFQLLTAGDYWLSVYVKGVGNKTIPVHIEPNQPHDLAALQLEAPSELVVVLVGPSAGLGAGARVVARNLVGDKFVASQAAGDGVAKLRPLPPGPSQLLVYGPSIAPVLIDRDLAPGQQWLDVAVAPANPVRIRFPFALADNPFVINGPLHVRVYDDDERIVLEDYLGTTTDRGRFTIEFGLPSGRYRVVARSIWNACAEAQLDVVAGQTTDTTIRLER